MKHIIGILLLVGILFGCTSGVEETVSGSSTDDPAVGDDTYVPDFQSGDLLFENTWIPDSMETGTRQEIRLDLTNLGMEAISNVSIMVELKELKTGSLAEVDPTAPEYAADMFLILFEIPEIVPGEPLHLTKEFVVPPHTRQGIYAGIFAVEYQKGIDTINSRAVSASTLVGKPDLPNLRILEYSMGGTNGYSFELPRQVAPDEAEDLGEPTWILNLGVEAMGTHAYEETDVRFELNLEGMGSYPLKYASFDTQERLDPDGRTQHVNVLKERYVFEKECKMYRGVYPVTELTPAADQYDSDLEVCAALFRQTTYHRTFFLYLPQALVSDLEGFTHDIRGVLKVSLNKDLSVPEWNDLVGDNVLEHPVIFLAENTTTSRTSGYSTANVETYENCMADWESPWEIGDEKYFKVGTTVSLKSSYRRGNSQTFCHSNGFADSNHPDNVEDPEGRITAVSMAATGSLFTALLGAELKPLDVELATMVDMDDLVSSNFLVRVASFDPRVLKKHKNDGPKSTTDKLLEEEATPKDPQSGIITFELYKSFPTNDNMWETSEECLLLWDPSLQYGAGSGAIRYQDDVYWSLRTNQGSPPPDNPNDWEKALWDQNEQYTLGDVVQFNGKAYEAIKINKAKNPPVSSEYWVVVNDCQQAPGDVRLENWQKNLAGAIISTQITNSFGQSSGYNTASTFAEWYDAISSTALDNSTNRDLFFDTIGIDGYNSDTLGALVATDNYDANAPTSCEQLANWNQADEFGLECWANVFTTLDSESGEERFTKYTEKEISGNIQISFLPVYWYLGYGGGLGLQGGLAVGAKNHVRFKQPFTASLEGYGGFGVGKATDRVQFRAGIAIKVMLAKLTANLVNLDFSYRPGVLGNDGSPGQFRLEASNPINFEMLSGKIIAEVELGFNLLISWHYPWSQELVTWPGINKTTYPIRGCLGDRLYADPSNPDPTTEYRLGAFPEITEKKSGSFIFNGINDYIQTGTDSFYDVGTGDFTADLWYYHGTSMYADETNDLISSGGFVSGTDGWSLALTANYIQPYYKSGGTVYKVAVNAESSLLTGGKWHHIQLERFRGSDGSRFYVYLNGNLVGNSSQVIEANLTDGNHDKKYLVFGGRVGGSNDRSHSVQGFLADIRLIGESLSRGAATTRVPSIPPLASDSAQTKFLLRAEKKILTSGPLTHAHIVAQEETGNRAIAHPEFTKDFAPYATTNIEIHPSHWNSNLEEYPGLEKYADSGCQGLFMK